MDFMTTIKSNNIQVLITDEFKNRRNNLLMFKYTDCKSVINDTDGKIIHIF